MHINFSLPFENPVLVFSIILFIILFAPLLFGKIKLPAVIGLIVAGIIVGPNGFNILMRNSSVELFGTVGLLYIMFLAGLEIDLNEFYRNKYKSLGFGFLTFSIPMILGTTIFFYIFDYTMVSSLLIASMFASHTLVTYPMVSKLGISKNLAVNVAVGGTMITDTAALLVLAVIAGSTTGNLDTTFWVRLTISVLLFAAIVIIFFPIISRWFFRRTTDHIMQYIFVMALVFLASFLALLAGIEAIIGAFLAGLVLNRLIPQTSPLMNRIEFVGNALFIPFFLIGVGMLIDYRVLFSSYNALIIAVVMTVVATVAKYLAAIATQKAFKFSKDQGLIIFGLSNSQAAATLAAVLIGYNIILGTDAMGNPIRLLNEDILNGTVVMILITCTIASLVTQKAAVNIAKTDLVAPDVSSNHNSEKMLIGLAKEDSVEPLLQFAFASIDKKKDIDVYGLNVIVNENDNAEIKNKSQRIITRAEKYAASVDINLHTLVRYDLNIVSGMINTIKEKNINHFFIGLHAKTSLIDTFFGKLTRDLLEKNDSAIYVYKPTQPLSTLKKTVLIIPENAELEPGFTQWFNRVKNIANNIGGRFEIFAPTNTINFIKKLKTGSGFVYNEFESFEDFLIISRYIDKDTLFIINLSRKNCVSYHPVMDKVGEYLYKHFKDVSFMLAYSNFDSMCNLENNPYANPSMKNNFISKL